MCAYIGFCYIKSHTFPLVHKTYMGMFFFCLSSIYKPNILTHNYEDDLCNQINVLEFLSKKKINVLEFDKAHDNKARSSLFRAGYVVLYVAVGHPLWWPFFIFFLVKEEQLWILLLNGKELPNQAIISDNPHVIPSFDHGTN